MFGAFGGRFAFPTTSTGGECVRRFYLEPDKWKKNPVLEGQEASHLARVLRARPGEAVSLFDGRGREAECVIETVHKARVGLRIVSEQTRPMPGQRIHLALGWTKSSRRGWFLEKCVELDAASILFWQAEHSQGRVPSSPKPSWEASLAAGAKQSGNPWLPELAVLPGGVRELGERFSSFDAVHLLWEQEDSERTIPLEELRRTGDILYVIGPEGGMTQAEADMLMRAGAAPLSLGPRIFRWETAALLCLGLCWWGFSGRG